MATDRNMDYGGDADDDSALCECGDGGDDIAHSKKGHNSWRPDQVVDQCRKLVADALTYAWGSSVVFLPEPHAQQFIKQTFRGRPLLLLCEFALTGPVFQSSIHLRHVFLPPCVR